MEVSHYNPTRLSSSPVSRLSRPSISFRSRRGVFEAALRHCHRHREVCDSLPPGDTAAVRLPFAPPSEGLSERSSVRARLPWGCTGPHGSGWRPR
ncbi:hypothetical protein SAY86_024472 [Trapa natans]|uniref:Uncharacterized protein n=1 Tax=Trapa natans TaxID=22666 RepID=A0AAN7M6Q1_TRANT|nr:hypothetical protein SAY86_024472 [Trapa natans]